MSFLFSLFIFQIVLFVEKKINGWMLILLLMDGDTAAGVSSFKRCRLYQGFSQAKLGTLTFLFALFY